MASCPRPELQQLASEQLPGLEEGRHRGDRLAEPELLDAVSDGVDEGVEIEQQESRQRTLVDPVALEPEVEPALQHLALVQVAVDAGWIAVSYTHLRAHGLLSISYAVF